MLVDLTLKDFVNKVAGSDPVPGGGSIAALSATISAALTSMVANLTIGKKKYAEQEERMKVISEKAVAVKEEFQAYIDKDSDAYNKVFACFKMPKETDEEKQRRSAAIQEATKFAAEVPLEVARKTSEIIPMIEEVAKKGNQNAVTDACVAMMAARMAVLGAAMNVRINLGGLKDKEWALKVQAEVDELEKMAVEREKNLLLSVGNDLRV